MEDKIEVNEYVRFNNGEIGKVIDIKENPSRIVYSEYGEIGLISDIVKHSKQLIDLTKIGDIVNGHLVIDKYEDVDEYGNDFWCLIIEDDSLLNRSIREEDIKTILTKESYMDNCYKVGGEDETSND